MVGCRVREEITKETDIRAMRKTLILLGTEYIACAAECFISQD